MHSDTKNHNSRGCIGSAAVCVLKALCLRDQHACSLASCTTAPLCQTACLFVLKQTLRLVSPPGSSWEKKRKLDSVWHWTSKTKCGEVDGTTEGKGQVAHFVIPVYFFFLYLQGWQALVPVPTCVYCFGDQTGHCLKRVSECEGAENGFKKCAERWMRSHWGTSSHCWWYSLPSKPLLLKQRATSSAGCIKDVFWLCILNFFFLSGLNCFLRILAPKKEFLGFLCCVWLHFI